MKMKMRVMLIAALTLLGGVTRVDAIQKQKIDASACDTVYTNYYFFLDAKQESYFDRNLSSLYRSTIGVFDNRYLISNFDSENIGYGQVEVSRTSTTSSDGITSMSLNDYYNHYLKMISYSNKTYSKGNNLYSYHGNWFSINADGTHTLQTGGLDLANYSKQVLMNASLNANVDFTLLSNISSNAGSTNIRIDRNYRGSLTYQPLNYGASNWYLQPAIFYVQYCSTKEETEEYSIKYYGNGSNVTNLPKAQYEEIGSCVRISEGPEREGYEFLGWSINSDATKADPDYAPGEKYCGNKGDRKLYAIWKEVDEEDTYYTITYKSNTTDEVKNLPEEKKQNANYDTFISTLEPKRNGYEFIGWSTEEGATVADSAYASGKKYTDRKDITLYAVWKKVSTQDPVLPSNPETGVSDYLLPFSGVIGASGLGLGILKKKKSFKQF